MIQAWFNERGYRIESSKSYARFIYDLPSHVVDNAIALYASRWMVFNQMMGEIKELRETIADQDLELNTDSRLIEELRGEITPDSPYAKSSLRYFIEQDYVTFRRVFFQKSSTDTINGRLSESIGQEKLATI